jgi:hypothetical protein
MPDDSSPKVRQSAKMSGLVKAGVNSVTTISTFHWATRVAAQPDGKKGLGV